MPGVVDALINDEGIPNGGGGDGDGGIIEALEGRQAGKVGAGYIILYFSYMVFNSLHG